MEPVDNLSDQGTTWIELGLTEEKQGRGFWRFNNLFLSDPEFLKSTYSVIMEYFVDEFNSDEVDDSTLNTCEIKICPILLLDLILAKVRGNTI